jgi:hypothetical protein
MRAISKEVRSLKGEVRALQKELRRLRKESTREFRQLREILQFVYDDDPANRRRLWELRASTNYELAFTEAEPLVSVIIPTYTRVETLVNVALPSVLCQTYERLEVLVVGDCAPPATGEALAKLSDPRIVYHNRERRGPYPADPERRARVAGGIPYNEGVQRAHGRWLARLDDDDAYRPHALETLVTAAKENRYELCYGRFRELLPDGTERVGERGANTTAAIYHAGLRFIECELADAAFNRSSDKSVTRRMLNCGVRIGAVDDVLLDYDPLQLRPQRVKDDVNAR